MRMTLSVWAIKAISQPLTPGGPISSLAVPRNTHAIWIFCRPWTISSTDMYRQLAVRVSVIAAVHTNETQYVPFAGERTERQWLANKERAQLCYHAAMIAHIVGVLVVMTVHWGCWNLDREHSMSPLELMNTVAHCSDESTRSLLHILRGVEDDASASGLKEFAHEWDAEHEKLLAYTKGRDGQWGFKLEVEEFEMTEQHAAVMHIN